MEFQFISNRIDTNLEQEIHYGFAQERPKLTSGKPKENYVVALNYSLQREIKESNFNMTNRA